MVKQSHTIKFDDSSRSTNANVYQNNNQDIAQAFDVESIQMLNNEKAYTAKNQKKRKDSSIISRTSKNSNIGSK